MKHVHMMFAALLILVTGTAWAGSFNVSYWNPNGGNPVWTVTTVSDWDSAYNILNNGGTHLPGTISCNGTTTYFSDVNKMPYQIFHGQVVDSGIFMTTNNTNLLAKDMFKFAGPGASISRSTIIRDNFYFPASPSAMGSGVDLNGQKSCVLNGDFIAGMRYAVYSSKSSTAYADLPDVIIDGCNLMDCKDSLIKITSANPAGSVRVAQSQLQCTGGAAIDIVANTNTTDAATRALPGIPMNMISYVNIAYCVGNGINIQGNNWWADRVTVQATGSDGINLSSCKYVTISNCKILEAGADIELPLNGHYFNDFNLANFSTYESWMNDAAGINLTNTAKNVKINNNEIYYNSANGIYFYNGTAGTTYLNLDITDNSIHTNGRDNDGYGDINLENYSASTSEVDNIRIVGNHCYDDRDLTSWFNSTSGLLMTGSANGAFKKAVITGNDFSDPGHYYGSYVPKLASPYVNDHNLN